MTTPATIERLADAPTLTNRQSDAIVKQVGRATQEIVKIIHKQGGMLTETEVANVFTAMDALLAVITMVEVRTESGLQRR
jgi:hypothetical protein